MDLTAIQPRDPVGSSGPGGRDTAEGSKQETQVGGSERVWADGSVWVFSRTGGKIGASGSGKGSSRLRWVDLVGGCDKEHFHTLLAPR